MKALLATFLIAGNAFGGTLYIPELPELTYTATARDPFVDASVLATILGATGERDLRHIAPSLETYSSELEGLLGQSHKVNGIAIDGALSMVVINGKPMKSGVAITLPLSDDLAERLLPTSRYYGLGLDSQIESKILHLNLNTVTPSGITLTLRGLNLQLPYQKELSPESPTP